MRATGGLFVYIWQFILTEEAIDQIPGREQTYLCACTCTQGTRWNMESVTNDRWHVITWPRAVIFNLLKLGFARYWYHFGFSHPLRITVRNPMTFTNQKSPLSQFKWVKTCLCRLSSVLMAYEVLSLFCLLIMMAVSRTLVAKSFKLCPTLTV